MTARYQGAYMYVRSVDVSNERRKNYLTEKARQKVKNAKERNGKTESKRERQK